MTTFDPGKPIVVGNWKQNTTLDEAVRLARDIVSEDVPGVQRAICPPTIWLTAVHDVVAGSGVQLGAQTVSRFREGAHTGETSARMIAEVCAFAVVGHSERRRLWGVTDHVVNEKVRLALEAGIGIVLCVGESAEERDAGRAEATVERQLEIGLAGIDGAAVDIVVAYEPVWAIGTGRSATPADAEAMAAFIARVDLATLPNAAVPVLYGGSVTSKNAAELFIGKHVAGFLVGGASLRADEFTAICRAIASGN